MSIIKKNVVSTELNNYSIGILGSSGVGKTTLMVDACTKEFGEEGYVIFDMGLEEGCKAIDGARYIKIPDWKTFAEASKELIEKKDEDDYKKLKIIVFDTIDQLFEFAEQQVINMWNRENMGVQNFKKCTSINSAYGGFGKGLDKTIEIIFNVIKGLNNSGYRVWYCGHVKLKDSVDSVSGEVYSQLTSSLSQKYFNAIKDKMHVVGVAIIDRNIETIGTGRTNIANKKEITKNIITDERRKIVFRDEDYCIDAKSRFADIVNEIPLSADEFLKALHDAAEAASKGKKAEEPKPKKTTKKKEEPVPVIEEEVIADDFINEPEPEPEIVYEVGDDDPGFVDESEDKEDFIDLFDDDYPEDIADRIKELFKNCTDKAVTAKVKDIIRQNGNISSCPVDVQHQLYDMLNI
ncbi:MAG: AAA family ATPase [Pseudobutyrivibrio sp.]|nr:AAA family ATPase [Pseudobutyrivibrio sp.]